MNRLLPIGIVDEILSKKEIVREPIDAYALYLS